MLANARIVFFSGTGCTARSADALKGSLEQLGVTVALNELRGQQNTPAEYSEDLLVLMYPVHAFDAPSSIYEYVECLHSPHNRGVQKVAIIPVSGSGDMAPNRACSFGIRQKLEQKGFAVVYESMIVMPCNTIVRTPDLVSKALLSRLPLRCGKIAADLVEGVILRKDPPLIDRLFLKTGEWERGYWGRKRFGEKLKATRCCTSCGWCARTCPRENIEMVEGVPRFRGDCALCLRCIYGCPEGAISAGYGAVLVLKGGFDLDSYDTLPDVSSEDLTLLTKGVIWKGVRKYLAE